MLNKPWRLGVRDGLENPDDLGRGLTWEGNAEANEAYDRGVNVGQALARLGRAVHALVRALSAKSLEEV